MVASLEALQQSLLPLQSQVYVLRGFGFALDGPLWLRDGPGHRQREAGLLARQAGALGIPRPDITYPVRLGGKVEYCTDKAGGLAALLGRRRDRAGVRL